MSRRSDHAFQMAARVSRVHSRLPRDGRLGEWEVSVTSYPMEPFSYLRPSCDLEEGLSFDRLLSYHICSMSEKKVSTRRPSGGPRRRRKPAGASTGMLATDLQSGAPSAAVAELHRIISEQGGQVLSAYREPYGGHWLVMAALPIEMVAPTPYQRNLSETHARKLEAVIGKLGRFLDPIIAVRAQSADAGSLYWTPNGHHRLSAMRTLGAKSIIAIVVPEAAAAYQILALNTEKAHNLREKALEVIRMYRELSKLDDSTEESYSLEFEEPALITLGLCYEERPRFSGGAYHPVLKRVDSFFSNRYRRPWRYVMPVPKACCPWMMPLSNRSKRSRPRD